MAHLVLREPQVTSEKEVVANERRYRVDDDVEGAVERAPLQDRLHLPPVPLADDRLDGRHRGLHAPTTARRSTGPTTRRTTRPSSSSATSREGRARQDPRSATARSKARRSRTKTRCPSRRRWPSARVSIKKPTAEREDAHRLPRPGVRRRRPRSAHHAQRGLLRRTRLALLPRARHEEQELCTELRGWVSTFRDPGLYEIYVTARPGNRRGNLGSRSIASFCAW